MKRISAIILSLIIINGCGEDIKNKSEINAIINRVKSEAAPDGRVAVFDIEAEASGKTVLLKGETNLPDAKTDLLEKIKKSGYEIEDSVMLLPDKKIGEDKFAVVNMSVINLRKKPKVQAELVSQALLGTPLRLLKKKGSWYLVQTPDKYIAWTEIHGFTKFNSLSFEEWQNSDKIIFKDEYGFSYSGKSSNSKRVSDLVFGSILQLKNGGGNYYSVNYPDGREAYVEKRSAIEFGKWLKNIAPDGESILQTAEKFIGVPYLWGGTSAKGFDCSGFIKTIYFMSGVILPRDASQQVNTGLPVNAETDFNNCLPGDLLFFGRKASGERIEKITHVAIYIGNNEFIHCSGRVKINSFDKNAENFDRRRLNGFIRAKRILSSVGENGIEKITSNSFYFGE